MSLTKTFIMLVADMGTQSINVVFLLVRLSAVAPFVWLKLFCLCPWEEQPHCNCISSGKEYMGHSISSQPPMEHTDSDFYETFRI